MGKGEKEIEVCVNVYKGKPHPLAPPLLKILS